MVFASGKTFLDPFLNRRQELLAVCLSPEDIPFSRLKENSGRMSG